MSRKSESDRKVDSPFETIYPIGSYSGAPGRQVRRTFRCQQLLYSLESVGRLQPVSDFEVGPTTLKDRTAAGFVLVSRRTGFSYRLKPKRLSTRRSRRGKRSVIAMWRARPDTTVFFSSPRSIFTGGLLMRSFTIWNQIR